MKTVIVDLTVFTPRSSVIAAAIKLAETFNAHVVGFYVMHSRLIHTGLYGFGGAYFDPDLERTEGALAKTAEAQFLEALANTGLTHEFRLVDTEGTAPIDMAVEGARLGDIFVTGQEHRSRYDAGCQADALGQIILGSGRPMLIIPEHMTSELKFGKALVAWDGSREASRAAFDALPLLKKGDRCTIVSASIAKLDIPQMRDSQVRLAKALDRHGIETGTKIIPGRRKDYKVLTELAAKEDLIVMGAYNHSRLGEELLGGVTRSFLQNAPCPVLISA